MSDKRQSTMRELVDRVEPLRFSEVSQRAADQRRHRLVVFSGLTAIVAIAIVGAAVVQLEQRDDQSVSVASEGSDDPEVPDPTGIPGRAEDSRVSGVMDDGMGLAIETTSGDPAVLRASVSAPTQDGAPYAQHDLVVTNATNDTLYFADPRHAELLGAPPSLVVGMEGCGFGRGALPNSDQLTVGCRTYWAGFSLGPGESRTLPLSIWIGIDGLSGVTSEPYTFETEFAYRADELVEPSPNPAEGLDTILVSVTYQFASSQ